MDARKGHLFQSIVTIYQKLEKQVSEAVSLSKTSRQNLLTHMYIPGSISCLQSAQHKHIKLAVVQCVRQTG